MYQPTSLQLEVFKYFKEKLFPSFKEGDDIINSKIIEYENDNFIYLILEQELFLGDGKNYFLFNNKINKSEAINLYEKGISFEMLCFDLTSKKQKYIPYYIFFGKYNFQLRFSKTYGKLEISNRFSKINFLETVSKNRRKNSERREVNFYNLKHNFKKKFSINKNNKTLFYRHSIPTYISLKNFASIPKIHSSNKDYKLWLDLILILLNGHLNSEFDFEDYPKDSFYNIENKLSYGKQNFREILDSLVPNIPESLKNKESVVNLIDIFKLIKKEDHKKLFNFYEQCLNFNIQIGNKNTINEFSIDFLTKLISTSKIPPIQKFNFNNLITSPLYCDEINLVERYIQKCFEYNKKINLDFSSIIKMEYETDLIENLSVKFNPPPKHYRLEKFKNFFEENTNLEIKLIINRKEFSELIKKINLKIFSKKKAIYYFKITLPNSQIEEGIIEITINKKSTFDYNIRGAWESLLSSYTKNILNKLMTLFVNHKLVYKTKVIKVEEKIELPF